MHALRWLTLIGLGLSLCAACAGKSQDSSDIGDPPAGGSGAGSTLPPSGGSSAGGAAGQPPGSSTEPDQHRATAERCDDYRASGNSAPYFDSTSPSCTTDGDCSVAQIGCGANCRAICFEAEGTKRCAWTQGECARDSDCMAGPNGRCDNNREQWSCSYDECFEDSACTNGGPCACGGRYGGDGPNTCMAGDCQTDSDCGAGGYCSPTQGDCGSYSGIIGYYCHTPEDLCENDSECADPTQGPGYCMYRPELGHWVCGYGQCVG